MGKTMSNYAGRYVWVNLNERKDYLIQKGNYCLSTDDIGARMVIAMIAGAILLALRVLIFGLPQMSEKLLSSTSLTIAGIIMYLPLYIVVISVALIVYGVYQKRKIEKELKDVMRRMDDYRLCW